MTLAPIRVAPSGRYFETLDGDPFLFIGYNDAVDWPGLTGLYHRRDLQAVDKYLADVAASGVTILRLMLEYVHQDGWYFEQPAGRFTPHMIRLWDDLFARCETHGLRILLAPWDNFWMARRWGEHPYNVANGGPAGGPHSFLSDPAVIEATKARLRFVIERWGGSGVLAAWDLFNEIDPYWGGTPQEQYPVIRALSEAVREAEEKAWGFTRPQTVSIFGPSPNPAYEDLIFCHPSLDFATTHIYEGAIDFPHDTVAPAVTMARWVRHGLDRLRHFGVNRPFMDTEHGPIHLFNDHKGYLPESFDDEYERHLMWAHLASGGAGSGMRWPARHPHLPTPGMRRALGHLAAFARLIDWRHFAPGELQATLEVGEGTDRNVFCFGSQDARQAVLWLLRTAPDGHRGTLPSRAPLHDIRLVLHGMADGRYRVQPFDTTQGKMLVGDDTIAAANNGRLCVTLPPFAADLALAVKRSE